MLFAHLDDIHVLCDPDRVAEIFRQIQHTLHHQVGIQINLGKTRVWNGAAVKLRLEGEGAEEDRGLVVLGVPVGHDAFVQKWLADKEGSHLQFLARIRAVQDAQCAWLLLLCAAPKANHILRNLPPSFSQSHDVIAMPVP